MTITLSKKDTFLLQRRIPPIHQKMERTNQIKLQKIPIRQIVAIKVIKAMLLMHPDQQNPIINPLIPQMELIEPMDQEGYWETKMCSMLKMEHIVNHIRIFRDKENHSQKLIEFKESRH